MIGRWSIFFRERFPLHRQIPYALLSYFGLYFTTQALLEPGELQLAASSFVGAFSVLGVMLLMRIFDEFKDRETDRSLFPDRPLSRGAVEYRDIRMLGYLVFAAMAATNALLGWVNTFFWAMVTFAWLSSNWFFFKKRLQNDLILSLVSHQPLALLVNLYVVAAAIYLLGASEVRPELIVLVIAFFLPVLAWETSRKIRARGHETNYPTYSKLLGPRRATLLPLISMLLFFSSLAFLAFRLRFGGWFLALLLLIALALSFAFVRFLFEPDQPKAMLGPVTEIALVASLLLIDAQLLIQRGLAFRI